MFSEGLLKVEMPKRRGARKITAVQLKIDNLQIKSDVSQLGEGKRK